MISGSVMRPGPCSPFGELALLRAEHLHASLDEPTHVLLCRRVLPHADVHRRRGEHRASEGQRGLREDVVGETVRQLRQRVGGERRDDEKVGVDEMGIEIAWSLAPRERLEGVRRDELLCVGCEDRSHLVSRFHEQPNQLAGLVGRDTARDADEDASHPAPFVRADYLYEILILPSETSSRAIVR